MIRTMKLVWTVLSVGVLAMATRTRADGGPAIVAATELPVIPATVDDDATQVIAASRFAGHQPPAEDPFPYRQPQVQSYSFRAAIGGLDEFNQPAGKENTIYLTGSKAFIARASRAILDTLEQEAA